nr:ciliary opsin [Macrobiotus pallari]
MSWESSDFASGAYIVYLFIFGLVIPVLVVLYAYILILYKIIKVRPTSLISVYPATNHSSFQGAGQSVAKGQNKVTRMIIMMVAAFLFAWMPYAVVSLIVVFGGDALITPSAAAAPAIFAKTSIVYNPMIYVLANPQVS